jgi:hypothetical protein
MAFYTKLHAKTKSVNEELRSNESEVAKVQEQESEQSFNVNGN